MSHQISLDHYMTLGGLHGEAQHGPRLLQDEIAASFIGCSKVHLPFASSACLIDILRRIGIDAPNAAGPDDAPPKGCDGCYFGTPTIIDGCSLFAEDLQWSLVEERSWVQMRSTMLRSLGYRRIVCGLGSGDISVDDRIDDLRDFGRCEVVAYKNFRGFEDWVISGDSR